MIKIDFPKPNDAKADYLKAVKPAVLNRLEIFKKTLDDIKGPATRVVNDNIDSYKVTTKELILLMDDPQFADDAFHARNYQSTVDNYVADPHNQLKKINLIGLRQFTENLINQNTKELDELLTCPAAGLAKLNKAILAKYKLNNDLHKSAIKLIFDYERWDTVGKAIREFFRVEPLVVYCPYCNMLEADYSEDDTGKATTIPILDHFYDKASTPLLGYSMYNLVPCDSTCNGPTIKHDETFDENYHLSPYERGFDKAMMVFEAVIGKVSEPLQAIHLNVIPAYGTKEYRKLVGASRKINEASKKGNINLFKHRSRYNKPPILEHCGAIMNQLQVHITNRRSLKGFLHDMKLENDLDSYKRWYYQEFKVHFDEARFHENRYSKLIRDLHDKIIQDSTEVNNDFKKFIQ